MKKFYLLFVLLVPAFLLAQETVPVASDTTVVVSPDASAVMSVDTSAVISADTSAVIVPSDSSAIYDNAIFGEETKAQEPAMGGNEYLVEAEGAKTLGMTAGINVGYPAWKSSGLADNDAAPQFGVILGTPYGLDVGPFSLGLGAEIGYYSFPYPNSTANEAKGLVALATVNTLLADTPYGPVSARVGAGYYGSSVGATAGVAYDYTTPALPVLIRVYGRANATLDSGKNLGGNASQSVSWITIGAMLSYDLSGLF